MSRAGGRVARLLSTVTLGRLLYAAHVTVVVTLGLLVVFGRSRYFPVLAILFLFGFILSVAIAALTVFRRKGFALRTTLLFFVAAPFVAVVAVAAHARWVDSRWPANRDCLQDLAQSIVKEFEGLGESTIVWLTPMANLISLIRGRTSSCRAFWHVVCETWRSPVNKSSSGSMTSS